MCLVIGADGRDTADGDVVTRLDVKIKGDLTYS